MPTYKILLRVIPEVHQARGDCPAILLPFACAEDHLCEVPHPADDRDISQLLLGQDLGALKQKKRHGVSVKETRGSPTVAVGHLSGKRARLTSKVPGMVPHTVKPKLLARSPPH